MFAFLFPSHLTTPDLRASYSPDAMRALMAAGLVAASGFGAFALYKRAGRRFAWIGLGAVAVAMALGGPGVEAGPVQEGALYVGLDWFIIGLVSSGAMFVLLEKLSPLRREQSTLRAKWQHDMKHFLVNHLMIGVYLLVANTVVHQWLGWMIIPAVGEFVGSLPFAVQFVGVLLAVDLMAYWVHRLYHTEDFFWRIHSVHHSTTTMDWLAGSRLNFMEPMITRTGGLLAITALGFDAGPINAYIVFAGFHATWIHANLGWDLRWIERVWVTPKYHHWHHSDAEEAINVNYANYFTFLDRIFGSQYNPDHWPEGYGVLYDAPPEGFLAEQLHPFAELREMIAED